MINLKNSRTGKKLLFVLISLAVAFGVIQFIRPVIPNPRVTADIEAPATVQSIIKRACYDCHSNETNLRWYDEISPIYWQVATHVKDGREGLNFSNWKSMAPADRKAKLWESVNQVIAGAMPLKSYEFVHTNAKISPEDLCILKAYAISMASKNKPGDTAKINTANQQYEKWKKTVKATLSTIPVAPNGIKFIPGYKNWQDISITDRFDNGTMRVIFGNDVAIKAIQSNNIHPWPNGSTFAKVAWDQAEDKEGNVTTGAFKQIEYMIKDDHKYASTLGWGFARFKTIKMIPYGKTVMFTTECVNCHRPQKDEDFVFTQPIKH